MTTTEVTSPFDALVFEEIPDAPKRTGGKGREPVKWEILLAPLQEQLLEKPARLWTYDVKTGAVSRMSAVRTRLADAAPELNWEFKVRPVPNTDPQTYGIYAVFHGNHTSEQMVKNAQERVARKERAAKAQESKGATEGAADPAESAEGTAPEAAPAMTAKEKLAAKATGK